MKKKSIVMLATGIVLAASLVIGGTLAYFTDSKTAENTFTVGKGVSITLDEAPVVSDGNGNYNPATGDRVQMNTYENIAPGSKLAKDPMITNTSEDAIYARMKVTISNAAAWNAATKDAPNSILNIQEGWELAATTPDATNDTITYTYNYTGGDAAGKIAANGTVTLFTQVTIPNMSNDKMAALGADGFKITLVGEAIQSVGFENAEAAFAAIDQALADNAVTPAA